METIPTDQLCLARHRASIRRPFDNEDSSSTPFVSAPSSPRKSTGSPKGIIVDVPASPSRNHLQFRSSSSAGMAVVVPSSWDNFSGLTTEETGVVGTSEGDDLVSFSLTGSGFDFSARFSEVEGSLMSSADELFYNGQIRPLRPLSHLQPQQQSSAKQHLISESDDVCAFDFKSSANFTVSTVYSSRSSPNQDHRKPRIAHIKMVSQDSTVSSLHSKGLQNRGREDTHIKRERDGPHRRTRSLSPFRVFHMDDQPRLSCETEGFFSTISSIDGKEICEDSRTVPCRRPRSRGWTLKELLHMGDSNAHKRERSRGSSETRPFQEKEKVVGNSSRDQAQKGKGASATIVIPTRSKCPLKSSKGSVSPHELHYMTQRAQSEQMRTRTFLPYRQGLLGCLGLGSKSYDSVSVAQNLRAPS